MENNNLTLWKSVSRTDPVYTKAVQSRGGYTAISPQYQARMATEQFGTYGSGWGLSKSAFSFELFESTGMALHEATFFYVLDGKRHEFIIHNAIKVTTTTQKGTTYSDEDFAKKVETNTISKALSKLGFNADVFMGLFDDHSYVASVGGEFAIEKADNKDAEREKQKAELSEWYEKNMAAMKKAVSMPELAGLYKATVRKLNHRGEKTLIQNATTLKDEVKAILEQDNETA